ncbi:hypothetical protein J2X36_002399 [Methylobacterium sp. BE186]|uniref:hypothetical protein n=1 Tax=Methylobacterium sp. BE186 TaxID=2817715 RepID=UPI00285F77B6|nr:hypothetical protein [Methylobacterium sp. BE186]MDR7037648.1 hypothetical protein [Methylobacterium sp. BE186]
MAAVISFFRPASTTQGAWSQQELAEFYRVEAALIRAGMRITSEQGLSDEADPWFVFCRPDGDAIMHFARIDGSYVVASEVLDHPMRGTDFRALLDEIAVRNPALLPMPHAGAGTKLVVHPAALLAALVAAAALILSSEDAAASELETLGPDGFAPALPPGTATSAASPADVQPAKPGGPGDTHRGDDHRRQIEAIVFSAMIFAAQAAAADEIDRRADPDLLATDPAGGASQAAAPAEAPPAGSPAGSGRGEPGTIRHGSALDTEISGQRGDVAAAGPERPGGAPQSRAEPVVETPELPKLAAAHRSVPGASEEAGTPRSAEGSLLLGAGRPAAADPRSEGGSRDPGDGDGHGAAKAGGASAVSSEDTGSSGPPQGSAQSTSQTTTQTASQASAQGGSGQSPWLVSALRGEDGRSDSSSSRGKAIGDTGQDAKAEKDKGQKDKGQADDQKGGSERSAGERAESETPGPSKPAEAETGAAAAGRKAADTSHPGASAAAPGQNKGKGDGSGAETNTDTQAAPSNAGGQGAKADAPAAATAAAEAAPPSPAPGSKAAPGQAKHTDEAAAAPETAKATGSEKHATGGQGSKAETLSSAETDGASVANPAANPTAPGQAKHLDKAAAEPEAAKVTGSEKHAAEGQGSKAEVLTVAETDGASAAHPAANPAAPGQTKHADKAAGDPEAAKATGSEKHAAAEQGSKAETLSSAEANGASAAHPGADPAAPGQAKHADKAAGDPEAAKATGSEKHVTEAHGSKAEAAPDAPDGTATDIKAAGPGKAADAAGSEKGLGPDKHAADSHAKAEAPQAEPEASDANRPAVDTAAPEQPGKHPEKAVASSEPPQASSPDKHAVDGHDPKAEAASSGQKGSAAPNAAPAGDAGSSAEQGQAAAPAHPAASGQPALSPVAATPDKPAHAPKVDARPGSPAATIDADGNLVFAPVKGSQNHPAPGHAPQEVDPHADVGLVGLSQPHAPLHHPELH